MCDTTLSAPGVSHAGYATEPWQVLALAGPVNYAETLRHAWNITRRQPWPGLYRT